MSITLELKGFYYTISLGKKNAKFLKKNSHWLEMSGEGRERVKEEIQRQINYTLRQMNVEIQPWLVWLG